MKSIRNTILISLGIVVVSLFCFWLLLFNFSSQFRYNSKQFTGRVLKNTPFLAEPDWPQSGEEKIIPVEIVNKHPQMKIAQSEFVSFDFVTNYFTDYLNRHGIKKIVIHLTDEPQYINQAVSLDASSEYLSGFSADEVGQEAHIYLFASKENLLKNNYSIDEIEKKIEWNLISGFVFLSHLMTNSSGERVFHKSSTDIYQETQSLKNLIDLDKNNQPLFGLDLN